MAHYYATYNVYGINTTFGNSGLPCGDVCIFDTKAKRDAWIVEAEDYKNGNCHTEPVDGKTARKMMVNYIRYYDVDALSNYAYLDMDSIIKLYQSVFCMVESYYC